MVKNHKIETCIIRPIEHKDIDDFMSFAAVAGDGMTTVPRDKKTLKEKIERSLKSFAGKVRGPEAEYFMVMENLLDKSLIGCTAVYPSIGYDFGFFSFRKIDYIHSNKILNIRQEVAALHVTNEYTGHSEVGSLILHPAWRGSGAAKLLVKSRYLLMAEHPDLFADFVVAEMRGYQDDNGQSPFWNSVGARFFDMSFAEADLLSAVRGNQFIADLMPSYPLYLNLMDKQTQKTFGKPFKDSEAALAMLKKEGFRFEGCVDIFDSGPQVIAEISKIKTVKKSQTCLLSEAKIAAHQKPLIACTRDLNQFQVRLLMGQGDDKADLWHKTPWSKEETSVRTSPL